MSEPLDSTTAPIAIEAELHTHPHGVFFGRYGMRAGWALLIFFVAAAIMMALGGFFAAASSGMLHQAMAAHAAAQAHPHTPQPKLSIPFKPTFVIVSDGFNFVGLLLICFFFSRGERRKFGAYGIGERRIFDVVPGFVFGLAAMSLLVLVLRLGGWLVFDGINVHGAPAIGYGIGWLIAFFFVGLSEEYTFRGFAQFTLTRGVIGLAEKISATHARAVAFWIAATLLSLLFACAHLGNGGETFFGLLQVFLAGITFAYALWRTGSLWWAIGFHASWDWAQSFLFGVADSGNVSVGRLFVTHPQGRALLSGGTTGPEGSIFATLALLLTLVIIHFQRPGVQPSLEQQPRFHSDLA